MRFYPMFFGEHGHVCGDGDDAGRRGTEVRVGRVRRRRVGSGTA
jgi:hypothetical protein